MTATEFHKQLAIAYRLMATWPTWKRRMLEDSAKPTVPVARPPIYPTTAEAR